MNVAAIGANTAGLAHCGCRGHIINKIPTTMMLYHAIILPTGRQGSQNNPMTVRNCKGLSHRISMLGLVASCEDANTRKVIMHPAAASIKNQHP